MPAQVTVNAINKQITVEPKSDPEITIDPKGPPGPPGPSGPSGVTFVREVPTGTIDGVNDVFSTSGNFTAGTTVAYLNGLAQSEPDDYMELGLNQVQFTESPLPGDRLLIIYAEG